MQLDIEVVEACSLQHEEHKSQYSVSAIRYRATNGNFTREVHGESQYSLSAIRYRDLNSSVLTTGRLSQYSVSAIRYREEEAEVGRRNKVESQYSVSAIRYRVSKLPLHHNRGDQSQYSVSAIRYRVVCVHRGEDGSYEIQSRNTL